MSKGVHSLGDHKFCVLDQIQIARRNGSDVDLQIKSGQGLGTLQIRKGQLLSATIGQLNGNGAALALAGEHDAEVVLQEQSEPVQKTISLSLEQIIQFISSLQAQPAEGNREDESKLLAEALLLFFQFKHKHAIELLLRILRQNRFYYPAWLWHSRLLTRHDYISKALDEAYRWGNDDRDVWREARKMRPQLEDSSEPVKRCVFCWSLLDNAKTCSFCKASFIVTGQPLSSDIKQDEVQHALGYFHKAFEQDQNNARVAYTLSLGYFNLKQYERALLFIREAVRLSPQTTIYRKSLSLLLTLVKTNSRRPEKVVGNDAKKADCTATVMMVEDSKTSRKVLSMLFERLKYRIVEAECGAEAMEKAQSSKIDLILLDLTLPDTNGHELLPRLRKVPGMTDVPVIMLTGRHDTRDRLLGIQSGASEYVTKPFNPQKLTALVQHYIQKRFQSADTSVSLTGNISLATEPDVRSVGSPTAPIASPPDIIATTPSPSAKNGLKSIFVIEDSQTSRKVISMILGRNGYHICEATTGEQALELAPDIEPDLILLDVMLPDTTGYTLLPKLKKLEHIKDIPVVMLTGKSGAADRMKGMLAGSNEYLTKPFDPQKLLTVIKGYL